jgi:hypothetical protein
MAGEREAASGKFTRFAGLAQAVHAERRTRKLDFLNKLNQDEAGTLAVFFCGFRRTGRVG